MGYSSSVYKAAADKLFERRLRAEKAAEKRERDFEYKGGDWRKYCENS